jgi:ankyrin repeat protein
MLEKLLIAKLNPDIQDKNGKTALHLAVERDDSESIDILLKYNANPKIKNQRGLSPLDILSPNDPVYIKMAGKTESKVVDSRVASEIYNAYLSPQMASSNHLASEPIDELIAEIEEELKEEAPSPPINEVPIKSLEVFLLELTFTKSVHSEESETKKASAEKLLDNFLNNIHRNWFWILII